MHYPAAMSIFKKWNKNMQTLINGQTCNNDQASGEKKGKKQDCNCMQTTQL